MESVATENITRSDLKGTRHSELWSASKRIMLNRVQRSIIKAIGLERVVDELLGAVGRDDEALQRKDAKALSKK